MEYPNDFNTPAFPAGKSIAFSRRVSIWISILFFLIIASCGLILLFLHLRTNYPFLISVDLFTNDWNVIAYPGKDTKETLPRYQVIQEKLVSVYATNWFTIDKNQKINDSRWMECSEEDCYDAQQYNPDNTECVMYCSSDSKLFKIFTEKVVPEYKALIKDRNETWSVGNMMITATDISESKSSWQVYATIHSSNVGNFNILAFVEIERDANMYPANLGYFVKDFNAYRITNEIINE